MVRGLEVLTAASYPGRRAGIEQGVREEEAGSNVNKSMASQVNVVCVENCKYSLLLEHRL